MAKEEVTLEGTAEEAAAKPEPIVNKRMVTTVAKALSIQLPGCLYHGGWFYVGERNAAFEKGKLTFVLAVEPSVSQADVLKTWHDPLTWLLRQVKKDNKAESTYLKTYAKLYRERQPGRVIYTLQFPDRCLDTLDAMVAIPEGVEIADENKAVIPEGDGSIC